MEYTKGTIGRVFLIKFSDKDIFLKEIENFARKEKVKAAKDIDPATGLNLLQILPG